jgi:hypothetical protein
MVNIHKTGFLKFNLEIIPKNTISGFCQNFSQAMDELKFFFANFQILGPLECQGRVVMSKNVKKPKSMHPTLQLRLKRRVIK